MSSFPKRTYGLTRRTWAQDARVTSISRLPGLGTTSHSETLPFRDFTLASF